jgi:hypothetical protein
MVGIIASVVVPTIPGRESLLSRCLYSIQEQAPETVEILVVAGTGPLGDKTALAAVTVSGDYMTVIDDDDYLDGSYMAHVLPELGDVDYVGYKVCEMTNGRWSGSSTTRGDTNQFAPGVHGPSPKGMTRADIWRQVRMGNQYTADRVWCEKVHPLIGSHSFIDRHLYMYDFWDTGSAFVGSSNHRDVGEWPVDWSRITRIEY